MKKVVLKIQETLKYNREVPILIPDEMTEKEFNRILDNAQRGAESVDDIVYHLKHSGAGIKQTEPYDTDLDSPDYEEVECDDYEFIDDEETQSA